MKLMSLAITRIIIHAVPPLGGSQSYSFIYIYIEAKSGKENPDRRVNPQIV